MTTGTSDLAVSGFILAALGRRSTQVLTHVRAGRKDGAPRFGSFEAHSLTDGSLIGEVRVARGELHGKPADLLILDGDHPELLWAWAGDDCKTIVLVDDNVRHGRLFGKLDPYYVGQHMPWVQQRAAVYGIMKSRSSFDTQRRPFRPLTIANNIVGLECKPRPEARPTPTQPTVAKASEPDRLTSGQVCVGSTNIIPAWVANLR